MIKFNLIGKFCQKMIDNQLLLTFSLKIINFLHQKLGNHNLNKEFLFVTVLLLKDGLNTKKILKNFVNL